MSHYILVMKNITITLEPEVAQWARIQAAKNDLSLSRMVGQMLKREMLAEKEYRAAMKRFISQPPMMIKDPGVVYPSRDALHER
ncbi:MAG: hypothetical protein ABIL58_14835 [Pseudomonadota bacterium]